MSVEANWRRLHNWCLREAPGTAAAIDAPADGALLDEVETATGRQWSAELRAWFGLHNGSQEGKPVAQVLPSYQPLPLERVAAGWTMMTNIWADMTAELGGEALLDEPAGTVAFTYLPAFIPIAENGQGDYLVVDTRLGDAGGCVREFAKEDADQGRMNWPTIDALLDDVASVLERNQPCRGWIPVVQSGVLDWDLP